MCTDFQLHILTEHSLDISVNSTEKALVSPAVFLGCLVCFVAFNLSALLQTNFLLPCHSDLMGMTLAVATKSR